MIRRHKVAIATAVVLLAGAGWYWYDLRPANIRRTCGNQVLDNLRAAAGSYVDASPAVDLARLTYELCVHRHGIEH